MQRAPLALRRGFKQPRKGIEHRPDSVFASLGAGEVSRGSERLDVRGTKRTGEVDGEEGHSTRRHQLQRSYRRVRQGENLIHNMPNRLDVCVLAESDLNSVIGALFWFVDT